MIDVIFKLNNIDYSGLLSTYKVTYEVEYPSVVTAIDGTEHGVARKRPTITFSLIPLSDAQTAALYTAIQSMNVSCTYTNPYSGATATGNMRVMTNLESAFGLKSVNGNRYYKGTAITLRQRTVL